MTQQFNCVANKLIPIRLTVTMIKKFCKIMEQSVRKLSKVDMKSDRWITAMSPISESIFTILFLSPTQHKNCERFKSFCVPKTSISVFMLPKLLSGSFKSAQSKSEFKLSRNCFCLQLFGIIRLKS